MKLHKWSKYSLTSENIGLYEEIFENLKIVDCHTHIGVDADGTILTAASMVKQLDAANVDKALVFPLNDPRDNKEFGVGNDEILAAAKKYPDHFVPFMRLNPRNPKWKKVFELRYSQGFQGVKLHPRSQDFPLTYSRAMGIYEACQNHNIPVLVHAGFGLEAIADDLALIVKTFPKLKFIIGHAGFVDLDNVIKKLKNKENVLFDTSTIKIFDLFQLFKNVDYRHIAFGSDLPYYDIDIALQSVIDSAINCGKTAHQIKQILGGNISRWFR